MNKNKTLNEVIDNFMMSQTYDLMLSRFQDKEFKDIREDFFDILTQITTGSEKEKIEDVVIAYYGATEKIGILIGFQFAFNLFQDLSTFGADDKECQGGIQL